MLLNGDVCMCVLHITLIFPPIYIQHKQCRADASWRDVLSVVTKFETETHISITAR